MSHLKHIYRSGIIGLLTLTVLLTTAFSGLAGALGSISFEMSNSNITIHVYQIGTLEAKNNQWQFTQNNIFTPIAFSLDDLDEINGIEAKRAKAAEMAAFAIDNKVPVYQQGVSDVYGSLTFSDIEEGVYLIVKTNDTAANVTIEPFFVAMPTQKQDYTGYEWNVTCKPKYEFDILDLNVWAKKVLVGRSLTEDEFNFQLTQVYSSNGDVKATLTAANDANGNIVFSALSFDKAGTYVFQLSEIAGSDSSATYDTGKYYVKAEISKNQGGGLTRTVTCGKEYNSSTHQLSDMVDLSQEYPRFENIIKGYINIRKISSSGAVLSGAQFQLSYRVIGSNGAWGDYGGTHVTAGTDGSVSLQLPEDYDKYEYRLIETKAPNGYNKSRVGTITFKVNTNGTMIELANTGTSGYVRLSADGTAIIVKNHISSGGSSGGGGSSSSTTLGSGSTTVATLPDESALLGDYYIEDSPVPLTGLPRTVDNAVSALVLLSLMGALMVGLFFLICKKSPCN